MSTKLTAAKGQEMKSLIMKLWNSDPFFDLWTIINLSLKDTCDYTVKSLYLAAATINFEGF